MTLESYEPQEFDELALRLLDIASTLRRLAVRCRQEQLESMAVNDRKALEWLGNVEAWASKAEADLELAILKQRGAQRADELARRKG
jgi:hypothetical protein